MALIHAVRSASAGRWPLWYQYAAVGYGWDPDTDALDIRESQRDAIYDADMGALLFMDIDRLASELDDSGVGGPRLVLDEGAFDDPLLQGDVARALAEDGARPTLVAPRISSDGTVRKQAMPICRDKRTGKARVPRVACDASDPDAARRNKRRVREPNTGQIVEVDCDNEGDCPVVNPRDTINRLLAWALVLGAIYMFAPAAVGGIIGGRVARSKRRGRR